MWYRRRLSVAQPMDCCAKAPNIARQNEVRYFRALPARYVDPFRVLLQRGRSEIRDFEIGPRSLMTVLLIQKDVIGLDVPVDNSVQATVVDHVQGIGNLHEAVPDEVLGKPSELTDCMLQISSGAVLEQLDQVVPIDVVSFECAFDHFVDPSVPGENLPQNEHFHGSLALHLILAGPFVDREFTGPLILH